MKSIVLCMGLGSLCGALLGNSIEMASACDCIGIDAEYQVLAVVSIVQTSGGESIVVQERERWNGDIVASTSDEESIYLRTEQETTDTILRFEPILGGNDD